MTVREAEQLPRENKGFLEDLKNNNQRMKFDAFIRTIIEIVQILIQHDPQSSFSTIIRLLRDLNGKEQSRLKAELVATLSVFGKYTNLVPEIIPELYRHLTNYESNLVRSRAIGVLADLLDHASESIPSNMIELLIVYLRDPYVVIHKNAIRTLAHTKLKQDESGWDALERVLNLEKIYAEEQHETRFLEDILRTLSSSFQSWPEVDRYVVTKLLPKYCRHSNKYFAEDMLAKLARAVKRHTQIEPEFVEIALDFIDQTWGDRHNPESDYSDRFLIWQALFNVPRDLLVAHTATLRKIAGRKIEHSPLEAYRAIELISHAGFHREALETANELLAALPDVKSNAYKRDTCKLIAAAEQAEILCVNNEFQEAIPILQKAEDAVPETEKLHEKWEEMWRDGLIGTP